MSTLSLGLPNSLHRRVRELASAEGISINHFIATAVAEKMSALLSEQYLRASASRGAFEVRSGPWRRTRLGAGGQRSALSLRPAVALQSTCVARVRRVGSVASAPRAAEHWRQAA
jgi:hypothetical protein